MALVKTVEMRILADAGDAQKKLDEMDARAKDLDSKTIKMRFRLDSADGKAQLDEIRAKAERLGYKDVRIKVRVDGKGRAVAELEAIKAEADKAGGGPGLLSRLLGAASGAAGGLPLIGGLAGSGPAGLAAVAGGLAALLPEVVAVGSGFAAAGAGAGSFYLLAHPAISSLTQDYAALQSAQSAYSKAQEKEALSPSKSNLKAEQTALLNLRAVRKGMTADESSAAGGISRLAAEYHKMTDAFRPQAFRIFSDGLRVAGHLLPAVTPMATAFAGALHPLMQQLDKFTQSKGFQDWLRQFTSLIGPAVTAIGKGIGGTVNELGKLMTVFSGKDVARGIDIAFGVIKGAIGGITGLVRGLKSAWDGISHTSTFKKLADDFKKAWDAISKPGGKKPDFSVITSALKDAVTTGVHWLSTKMGPLVNGAMKTASSYLAGHAKGLLVPVGQAVMQGLLDGMKSKIPDLIGLAVKVTGLLAKYKGPIETDRVLLVPHGKALIDGLISGMKSKDMEIRIASQVLAQAIMKSWKDQRSLLKAEIAQSVQVAQSEISANSVMNAGAAGPDPNAEPVQTGQLIGGMRYQLAQVKAFRQAIQQLKREGLNATSLSQIIGAGSQQGLPVAQALLSGGKQAVKQINALEKQLRGEASKLGNAAAGPMVQAGKQAGLGLAQGLKSELGAIQDAIRQLVKGMADAAKKALKSHSPSLLFAEIGTTVPQGVAVGIDRAAHLAIGASARLAGSTAGPWAHAGGGRGGGDVHVHFHGITPADKYATAQQVHQVLRDYKRDRGGAALGLG